MFHGNVLCVMTYVCVLLKKCFLLNCALIYYESSNLLLELMDKKFFVGYFLEENLGILGLSYDLVCIDIYQVIIK